MRCPRCQTEPPRDPFVCAHCGEHLLTYLDEPLGPGTGLLADGSERRREPGGAGVTGAGDDGRSWIARQIDPAPPPGQRRPGPGDSAAAQPARRSGGGAGSLIGKILLGLLIALFLLIRWPLGALVLVVGLAVLILRWPRLSFFPFAILTVVLAGTLWVVIEIADEIDPADLGIFPAPTPTVQRVVGTPTRPAGTPTLAPFQATATATAIAGESRALVARGRARWLRGDNQAALANLDRAITLTPGDASARNLGALVRIADGNYAGAVVDAAGAVSIQPSSGAYHDTYAYALLKSERYAEARDEYERALNTLQGPDRASALLGLGLAQFALAIPREAAISIGTGLALLPDAEPDPQLTDLEASARRALPNLPPVPSPAASPGASPAASPVPVASPSPAALLDPRAVVERAP